MDTAGKISVLIKFSPKRDKILENLKEQIKNSEQIIPNKIIKPSTTRWRVWQTFYHKMEGKNVSST